jgi:O-antigen/teichoic acid export membrane protein
VTVQLLYSSLSAASAGLMLLLQSIAARRLSEAAYGDLMTAIVLATIAEVFMDFGLHQVSIRAIAANPASAGRILRTSIALKALPGAGMVIVFGAIALAITPDASARWACLLMLGSAVMRSYLLTARGVMQGLQRFGHDALVTTADRALLVVACGLALWAGAGVVTVSLVFLITRAITALAAVALAHQHLRELVFDAMLWRTLPGEAIPVGLFLLVLNVYNRIDAVMLRWLTEADQVGYYTTAYALYEGLTYGAAVISAVLAPRLSRLWASDPAQYRVWSGRSTLAAAVLGALVAVAAWPLCSPVLIAIFSAKLAPAIPTLQWLVLGLPAIYMIWVLHSVAIAASKTRVLVIVSAVGAVFNITLNLWLIPGYTHAGAAMATVISEFVVGAALLVGMRRQLGPMRTAHGASLAKG